MKIKVAVAQAAPVVLDLEASVAKACAWIGEAGAQGAKLVAFPETWLPTYPFWCDGGEFGTWGNQAAKRLHARLIRNSPSILSEECDRIRAAAGEAGCSVVLGMNERGPTDTLFNTLLFISGEGEILGWHRKLVPTHGERLVWGRGDASGLRAFPMAGTHVGGLVCWEHWMPLPRQVLHAEGEEIHVAAWPHAAEIHQIASRHYAFEGRAFVLVAATWLTRKDLPDDFELPGEVAGMDVICGGGSAIIGPDGSYVVEPVREGEELLVAEIDLDRIAEEKLALDVAGHYSRPDLFDLRVRRDQLVQFREAPPDQ